MKLELFVMLNPEFTGLYEGDKLNDLGVLLTEGLGFPVFMGGKYLKALRIACAYVPNADDTKEASIRAFKHPHIKVIKVGEEEFSV